jgi:hypothetical protein
MAYFLKKLNRTFLAIYESFYSHVKKGTAHKCYWSFTSVEAHVKNSINDHITHFQKEVDALNRAR